METFTAIFTQLGVDNSLPYQFVIILVAFVLANFLFLGKLQEVLEVREEKTVKLENSADETIDKVSTMQTEYKVKIDEANRVALKSSTDKKQQITQKYTEQFKQAEKEVTQQVDSARNQLSAEIAQNKDKYMAESEKLSESLVQKDSSIRMNMRFWTAYAFVALGIVTKVYGSESGGHHSSITDLFAPAINVAILFGALVYFTKDKLKGYFVSHSEDIANTIERADIKSKEAHLMLENQKRKMASLETDVKAIHTQSETETLVFEKKLSQETEDKIKKLKSDAQLKIEADKKQMVDELNAELLEQVINKTKSTIKTNKDFQSKVSTKMLQGLQ